MKNKFFLLGILIALFAVSVPIIADPGGVVASGLESSIFATAPTSFTVDALPTVATVASFALVPILFLFPSIRRRVFSIPWSDSVSKYTKEAALEVRRTFDKLTVSPVLKRQSAA